MKRKPSSKRAAKPAEKFEDDGVIRIYMNHFIKEPDNKQPVITVQKGHQPDVIYVNFVNLIDPTTNRLVARIIYSPDGLVSAPFHHVKAWIETDCNIEAG